jgi:hypothetical protein
LVPVTLDGGAQRTETRSAGLFRPESRRREQCPCLDGVFPQVDKC